jgi:hypothetical protein
VRTPKRRSKSSISGIIGPRITFRNGLSASSGDGGAEYTSDVMGPMSAAVRQSSARTSSQKCVALKRSRNTKRAPRTIA